MAFAHLTTYMPPACSRHRLSFVYMRLHAHGIYPTSATLCRLHAPGTTYQLFYLLSLQHRHICACMLTALDHLPPPPLYRLHNHGNARPLPLQHRLRIHSNRNHHPTTPQHFTTLPPSRHSTVPTTFIYAHRKNTFSIAPLITPCTRIM